MKKLEISYFTDSNGCTRGCLKDEDFENIIPGEKYMEILFGYHYRESDILKILEVNDGGWFERKYLLNTGSSSYLREHGGLLDNGGYFRRYFDDDGRLIGERYYNKKLQFHNEHGPAEIELGRIIYYLNGVPLSKGEWEASMLTKLYW